MMLRPANDTTRFYHAPMALLGENIDRVRPFMIQGNRYRFTWSRTEAQVLRRRKKESPTSWAPKNIKVPSGPFESRYFSFEVTPHLYGMLEAYALPFIRKITVCAAPQTTKTTFGLVATAWSSVFEPGPVLHCYPTEATGVEVMEERITKIYQDSPPLRRLLTGRKEDVTKYKLRLRNMWHRIAWSGSATSLASRSVKIYIADEVDKYEEFPSEDEASTLDLLKLRLRTYRGSGKGLVMSSTSIAEGFVWRELTKETEAVFVFWSRCPYCGVEQIMDFSKDTWTWPHDEHGNSLDRKEIYSKKLARYVCTAPGCRKEWDDDARDRAQRLNMKHGWRLRTEDGSKGEEMFRYLNRHRPATIGFLVPSWISYFVSLSEVAADYLKCKDKNLSPEEQFGAYQHFQNAHRSLPWRKELQAQPVEKLLAFCDDRPEGVLPGGERVASLLASIDTQDDERFFLSIWAVGWGYDNEQWLVLRREVNSFQEIVDRLWNSEYYDADGQRYIVEHTLIDMLGHRTKEVLEFCIKYEGLISPCFGSARQMSVGYAFSQREYLPGTDQPIPGGGIRAIRMNTKYYKDNMAIKLSLEPDTPGCIHFYASVGEDYCKQLTSESRDSKGAWKKLGSRPNHYWDNWCAINCLADWLGIKHRQKPEHGQQDEEISEPVIVVKSNFMG